VQVEEVSRAGGSVRILARTTAEAACPGCGTVSRRVHSRYERRLLDTAIGGCEVVICLSVRRLLCLSRDCPKVTFAEQVAGLTSRHARRTPVVTALLEAVALALGGRAGARMTGRLAAAATPEASARSATTWRGSAEPPPSPRRPRRRRRSGP